MSGQLAIWVKGAILLVFAAVFIGAWLGRWDGWLYGVVMGAFCGLIFAAAGMLSLFLAFVAIRFLFT